VAEQTQLGSRNRPEPSDTQTDVYRVNQETIDASNETDGYYNDGQTTYPTPPPTWVTMLQRAILLNYEVDPFVICDDNTTTGTFYIGKREHVESLCTFLNKQPNITQNLGKIAVRSADSISSDHLLAAQFDSFHIHSYVDSKSGFVSVHSSSKWNGYQIIEIHYAPRVTSTELA